MTSRIDGKVFAVTVRDRVTKAVTTLLERTGEQPTLAVILVGEDPASQIYVRNKIKMTEACGMVSREYRLSATISEPELLALIDQLNAEKAVSGILVQLPLPKHLNDAIIIQRISPEKDVDGLHIENSGKLLSGVPGGMVPCTPLGCLLLLKEQPIEIEGAHALVIGRSNLFGKPMAQLLLQENATVTMAHSRTKNLADLAAQADILIAAVGVPYLVKKAWIKEGATLIDVGINRIDDPATGASRLVGDIDFNEAQGRARAITPVPGGVGPMTIACLLQNTVKAFCLQRDLPLPEGIL